MAMIASLMGYILPTLAVLGSILAAWFAGHTKGKAAADVQAAEQRTKDNNELAADTVKQNQAAVEQQTKTVVESNEIDQDVKRLSDDDLFNELHNGAGNSTTTNSGKK